MKALVLICAISALFIAIHTQQVNYIPALLIPANISNIGWNHQALNNTKWNLSTVNVTHHQDISGTNRWGYNYTTHNGDVMVGHIGYLDRLLFNRTYNKSGRWWSSREKTVEYPKDLPGNNYYRHETISAIRIYNRKYGGLHSGAEVIKGGVGQRYAKIRLSSSWGKGFRYEVQIFGH